MIRRTFVPFIQYLLTKTRGTVGDEGQNKSDTHIRYCISKGRYARTIYRKFDMCGLKTTRGMPGDGGPNTLDMYTRYIEFQVCRSFPTNRRHPTLSIVDQRYVKVSILDAPKTFDTISNPKWTKTGANRPDLPVTKTKTRAAGASVTPRGDRRLCCDHDHPRGS